jgi:hypothetical protein
VACTAVATNPTWPVPGECRVTGQVPPSRMAQNGQPWLRIKDAFERVPTAHSLAAPGTVAAANSGL